MECWFSSTSACFRSEGPTANSPVREGGDAYSRNHRGPKGWHKSWRTFGAQETTVASHPALTDGAISCRSFGPKSLPFHLYAFAVAAVVVRESSQISIKFAVGPTKNNA